MTSQKEAGKEEKRETKNGWDKQDDRPKPNHININNTLNISDVNTLKRQRLDKEARPKYMLPERNVLQL